MDHSSSLFAVVVAILLLPAVWANCFFNIRSLNSLSPVPVRYKQFLLPSVSGTIDVSGGAVLVLFCSTQFANYQTDTIAVSCVRGDIFSYAGAQHAITSAYLQCTSHNMKTALQFTAPDQYRIGFDIGPHFASTMDLVFDVDEKRTDYTHQA